MMTAGKTFRIAVLTPVYNDWEAARFLLRDLEAVAGPELAISVFAVNDGSSEIRPEGFGREQSELRSVTILHLVCNVGHQRAIALGLVYLKDHHRDDFDGIVVMDCDGEIRRGTYPGWCRNSSGMANAKSYLPRGRVEWNLSPSSCSIGFTA